jgi:membrane associated rhomboid family serine protease
VSSVPPASERTGFCYRHPDRQSYVLCQRCGRTICPQCQTQAAVGVHCPECVREARASAPRTQPAFVTALRSSRTPVVTYAIMALCVLVFATEFLPGGWGYQTFAFRGDFTLTEPWRLLTYAFVHSTAPPFLHIVFNLFSLWVLGRIMEPLVGRWRFIGLYLLSALGGSVAVLLLAPTQAVVGASGAIFGLFGALFVIQRRLGGNSTQLLIVLGLNLVVGFIPGFNISWQGHVGGLVVGAVVGLIYFMTRRQTDRWKQIILCLVVAVALIAIAIVRAVLTY